MEEPPEQEHHAAASHHFGFHSRASFWASAIWARVIRAATLSRLFIAFSFPFDAAVNSGLKLA
jgi:hypothetical protein